MLTTITKHGCSVLSAFLALFLLTAPALAQQSNNTNGYHNLSEVTNELQNISRQNGSNTKLHTLAQTPGGNDLMMIEIGPETGSNDKTMPAIFVVANMDGTYPISTEAALDLARRVMEQNAAKNKTWYILPNGNPDAAAHYFASPLVQDSRNNHPHNDDMDEATDEDGWDDLNGDGYYTKMRVKDPTGEWMPVEGSFRLMKKADRSKGEQGIYKVYTEGTDNDNDGEYNEDSPGGVNVNRNFPHLFEDFTETAGAWPGSTPESYAIMEFAFNHPEIAMTHAFGATNFSLVPPKGGRQGSADYNDIEIPEEFAEQVGADPNKTYTMDEVIELVKPLAPPGFEITESVVSSFLGLGAVVNPRDADLKFYNELSDQYKEYLKEKNFSVENLDPESAKDGSFELWSYYHLGLPTFSTNLWTLPEFKEEEKDEGSGLTAEKIEQMSSEEFVELGEDKIALFLEEISAPDRFNAQMVIKMVEGGQMTPERIGAMIKQMPKPETAEGADPDDKAFMVFNEQVLNGRGFVDWQTYNHPTLGEVEIGGEMPFARTTPPASMVDSLLEVQVPWVITLSEKIPKLSVLKTESKSIGGGVHEVQVWVKNEKYLPFPTAMGEKNKQPHPAILTLNADELEILSGKKRTPINSLGSHEVKKYRWLVRSPETETINVRLESTQAWNDQTQVNLGGSK
jgi:hypothetical protein